MKVCTFDNVTSDVPVVLNTWAKDSSQLYTNTDNHVTNGGTKLSELLRLLRDLEDGNMISTGKVMM